MNFPLQHLPSRENKPRNKGLTMVMDRGYSLQEIENFLSLSAEYIDVVKLGWGTSCVTPNLEEKLALYRSAGIPVYFGGTLFEIFHVRGQLDDYERVLEKYGMEYLEVSDGSIEIDEDEKCEIIHRFSKNYKVYSEVGSKYPNVILPPYIWIEKMQKEMEAGSIRVIAEARESGNVGMFRADGKVRSDLIEEILRTIPPERILWEAPMKSQQVWFIKLLGNEVNLGNIAPDDALPLETLRLGLRGDTFFSFLPPELQEKQQK
ncbi:MAG: phosphosulfolactate synthase [Bacteroidota bacterium]